MGNCNRRRTYHDLDHLGPLHTINSAFVKYCAGSVYVVVQIEPNKRVLNHAEYTAPTRRQHELSRRDQEHTCPERDLDHAVEIGYCVSDVVTAPNFWGRTT